MITPIFLATLGQRPEAITIAFDALNARFHYRQLGIIHTHPTLSGIATAYQQITTVLERDYSNVELVHHELTQPDGRPLIDITDSLNTDAYYTGMVRLLRDYRVQYQPIHLLVAGGRKTMSVYATLAATLLFGEHDLVWTVLTKSKFMQEGLFHINPDEMDNVTLVEMPLPISRLIPGEIARQSVEELTQRISPRRQFIESLTDAELELIEMLRQQPYASNSELGIKLNKVPKTVENQFSTIYGKLLTKFNIQVDNKHKRQALIDVIQGKV